MKPRPELFGVVIGPKVRGRANIRVTTLAKEALHELIRASLSRVVESPRFRALRRMETLMTTFVVNGTERRYDGDPDMPLLWCDVISADQRWASMSLAHSKSGRPCGPRRDRSLERSRFPPGGAQIFQRRLLPASR